MIKHQEYFSTSTISSVLAVLALSLLLAACGGGSGNGNDGDGSSGDDGGTDGNTTQTIPSTFSEGSLALVYAQSAADTVDSMQGTPFRTLGSTLKRIWRGSSNPGSISLSDNSSPYISSLTDHANGGVTAVFVVDGQEHAINFPPEKVNADYSDEDVVRVGDREFYIEPTTRSSDNNPLNEDYYSFGHWEYYDDEPDGYDGEVVYGARTGAELPMGTVRYTGNFLGPFFPTTTDGSPRWAIRQHLWGRIGLEADLDKLTISGEVNGLWRQETRENGNQWTELPDTTAIAISEGSIAGGRFVTTWEGHDTDPGNPAETSARGFAGDIVGDFYGPNAEEAAGVFNGRRAATDSTPEQVIWGSFGTERDE